MFTPNSIAGIVDLFGALTPEETREALSELAYRRGEDSPENAIDEAIETFALVEFEAGGERLLSPGPSAFPVHPEGSEDLPHILDVEDRSVDRDVVGRAATERLRSEIDRTVVAGERQRATELIEISYDVEAWGDVDLSGDRRRLEAVVDGTN